eukprot:5644172-Prymnesium_polylepis.1
MQPSATDDSRARDTEIGSLGGMGRSREACGFSSLAVAFIASNARHATAFDVRFLSTRSASTIAAG